MCSDVFKLSTSELRSCRCGLVKGRYNEDGHTSVTNGQGVCIGVSNPTLLTAVHNLTDLLNSPESCTYDSFRGDFSVEMWVRPHTGSGNPRNTVIKNLGEETNN